jgi:nucleoside-diphosphate-sugar epimerase
MRTALVSGSAGFIGRHLVPKLEEIGYAVTRVDRHLQWRPIDGCLHNYSLPVEKFVGQSIRAGEPYDIIIHLAANISNIDDRMKGGLSALQDITLDMAMFNYVASHPPKQAFIYPSSCAIDNPEDPYAFVKIVGERCCKELYRMKVPVVVLRPFSGYSADQSQDYPFPAILKRVMNRENPIEVWGDGSQIRDWLHISDLVSAFIHAIDRFPHGVPIDIGTGVGCTPNAVAGTAFDKAFPDSPPHEWPEIKNLTDKPMSSLRRVANISLATKYGWHSKISLEQGICMEVEAWRKLHP